ARDTGDTRCRERVRGLVTALPPCYRGSRPSHHHPSRQAAALLPGESAPGGGAAAPPPSDSLADFARPAPVFTEFDRQQLVNIAVMVARLLGQGEGGFMATVADIKAKIDLLAAQVATNTSVIDSAVTVF